MTNSISDELMRAACAQAMAAQKSTSKNKHYFTHEVKSSSGSGGGHRPEEQAAVIFAFRGEWDVNAWFHDTLFGEIKIDPDNVVDATPSVIPSVTLSLPSLRSIGNNEPATVNQSFLNRFLRILEDPSAGSFGSSTISSLIKNKNTSLKSKVQECVEANKQIVFTGHSSGGPMAIFATLWFLENHKGNTKPPHCITFGSPLVGDRVLSHAVGRQKWSNHFIHFVTEYDMVPRMMLSPFSSIEVQLLAILGFFKQKAHGEATREPQPAAHDFFVNVMRNTSAVASRVACDLMESVNPLLDTLTSDVIQISPYRPFGTFIFCTGIDKNDPKGNKPVIVDDPNAALQLLFYFAQLSSEEQAVADAAARSLSRDSFAYEAELNRFNREDAIHLKKLQDDGWPTNGTVSNDALNALSSRARLCLAAAEETVNRKRKNKEEIEKEIKNMKALVEEIKKYKEKCASGKMGNYYDAFKVQGEEADFVANVNRLKLAKIWDEIIEMLKKHELPDEFEGFEGLEGLEDRDSWLKNGTIFRELVEPLDIANYYRHAKGNETNTYLGEKGRPKRYRYTQRWVEHAKGEKFEEISHTNFWAEVEEVKKKIKGLEGQTPEVEKLKLKERVDDLKVKIVKWVEKGKLGKDVLRWCKRNPEVFTNELLTQIGGGHQEDFTKRCEELLADPRVTQIGIPGLLK